MIVKCSVCGIHFQKTKQYIKRCPKHSRAGQCWRNLNPSAYNNWLKRTKEKRLEYQRRTRTPEKQRAGYLKCVFGISKEEYNNFLQKQNNVCAICKKPETRTRKLKSGEIVFRSLAVDHDHKTKKVRGLLCASCNTAIGLLKESPEILRSALEYINASS